MANLAQLPIRGTLVGESSAMRNAIEAAEEAAQSDNGVLIEGEAGSGRELIARAIHYASARCEGEFVTFKAAATPSALIDGELSGGRGGGHLRRAVGGTLLVKDIVEVPRGPQKKLARIVRRPRKPSAGREETPLGDALDVRFIAATDVDPDVAVESGLLDKELYERLGARRIEVPPLRRRIEDIAPLTFAFVRQFAEEMHRGKIELASRVIDRLVRYPWPGNVSQLKDVCRRLLLRTRRGLIEVQDLDGILPELDDRVPLENMPFEEMVRSKLRGFLTRNKSHTIEGLYEEVIARVERPLIELVLEQTAGNQLHAARILGLNRNTLRKKIGDLRILGKKAR
jgi:two-component system, NtrC family, nitrogen regulation response regulator GlnG